MKNFLIKYIFLLLVSASVFKTAQAAVMINTPTDLYYPSLGTMAGNPQGHVTLVEFFDYRCHYCRDLMPVLQEIVKNNPQVRVVYRDYPILGFTSELAAQAALAAQLQGKYIPFHIALLSATTPLNNTEIDALAQQIGLNIEKLHADMEGVAVNQALRENEMFAKGLDINGIPVVLVAATPDSLSMFPVRATLLMSPTEVTLSGAIADASH